MKKSPLPVIEKSRRFPFSCLHLRLLHRHLHASSRFRITSEMAPQQGRVPVLQTASFTYYTRPCSLLLAPCAQLERKLAEWTCRGVRHQAMESTPLDNIVVRDVRVQKVCDPSVFQAGPMAILRSAVDPRHCHHGMVDYKQRGLAEILYRKVSDLVPKKEVMRKCGEGGCSGKNPQTAKRPIFYQP